MDIAIVAPGLPFDGGTLERRGIGGSETAVIYVARELQKLGHSVTVFSNPDEPGVYDGVTYIPLQHLQKVSQAMEWDVLIISRQWPMLGMDIKANYRVLWNHDVFTNPQMFASLFQTDKLFLLSNYHINNYMEGPDKVPDLRKIVFKTSNGVDLDLIDRVTKGVEKVPGKIIYTSRPERGLHYLLQMLPKILEVRPDAKIYYCNYNLGKLVPHEADQQRINFCEQLLKQYKDHVVNLGHLTKEQLYREMASAEVHAYPTAFPEISCITAMEAPACGTPIVTTYDFALKETVGHNQSGFLIRGLPNAQNGFELDPVYAAKFTRKVLQILNVDSTKQRFANKCRQWVVDNGFTWPQVAKSWSDLFESEMAARFDASPNAVYKELDRRGNSAAADLLRSGVVNEEVVISFPDDTPEAAQVLNRELQAIGETMKTAVNEKVERLLIAYPSNPLLPCLLRRMLPDAEIVVLEQQDGMSAVQQELLDANEIDDIVITDTPEGKFNLIVCQDTLGLTVAPEQLLRRLDNLLTDAGVVVYTTPYGPIADRAAEQRSRLWSIGPREWNDLLGGTVAARLSFMKTGKTVNEEPTGKWIAAVPKIGDTELGSIDIERFKYERPYQKLTACMIAYNAEDWILRCLKRVLGVADKVQIVVDTKTTDRTVELIESFNDPRISWEYSEFEDFARQRNKSIAGVGEDTDPGWVIWLDTDEMLVQETGLRKFLNSVFFNGYALPQCHLMLDVHGNRDNPIRVFRAGKPEYQFVGCIHEHAEDTSGGPDSPIKPAMVLEQIKLAHYGYENEAQRRQKCSNRNMALLQKDLQENPDRKLNKLLALRDYLHIPKWEIDRMQSEGGQPMIQPGSKLHEILQTAVDLYMEHLSDPAHKFHGLAFPHYQEALQIMAMFGLRYRNCPTPPFSLATTVTAGVGGPAKTDVTPDVTWFRSLEEASSWLNGNMRSLAKQIAPYPDDVLDKILPAPLVTEKARFEDKDGSLLGLGKDRIDKHGILI